MTDYREISGVCTHPSYVRKGYARKLIIRLMGDHAAAGVKSFLHVGKANSRAVAIYERMGFRTLRSIALWPISRVRKLHPWRSPMYRDTSHGICNHFARISTPILQSALNLTRAGNKGQWNLGFQDRQTARCVSSGMGEPVSPPSQEGLAFSCWP
jgi:FR47-like protein